MRVKCINQGNFKNITEGNEYEIVSVYENLYCITADNRIEMNYSKRYFEIIPEPIIEDIDEVGAEEEKPRFTVGFEEDGYNIEIHIDEVMAILYYYPVASNCGVYSYHGINDLFERCNKDKELFKEIINEVIESIKWEKNCCMFILSTNEEYEGIWTVLDEIMDTESNVVKNPNSDADVKLWIKYIH